MKVLITGGAGFIGSNTADLMINKGYDVVIVDNLSSGNIENINKKAKFHKIDIRDEMLYKIFKEEKPDYVIHLAAQINARKSIEDPISDASVNIMGGLNILNCCKNYGVTKIIYSSSAAVYGDAKRIPTPEDYPSELLCPYAISKYTFESYLKGSGVPYIILRYSNVYGPRQDAKGEAGVISIFISKLLKGESLHIFGDGEQTRDFIYVEDVAKAELLALQNDESGIFNISTGQETSVNNLFKILKESIQSKSEVHHNDPIEGEIRRSCLDCSKAKKELKWMPKISICEGLNKTVMWFQTRDSK